MAVTLRRCGTLERPWMHSHAGAWERYSLDFYCLFLNLMAVIYALEGTPEHGNDGEE